MVETRRSNASAKVVAREYLRVSRDLSGRERSPQEQHDDNERAAGRNGWTMGKPYKDIGSASRYATKVRKEFDLLVADLKAGRFDANVLILWESSRGSRKVSEWAQLIELCEARQVRIFVTSDAKVYDPADARDRRSLLEDSVNGEYESAKVSKRVRRAHAALAAQGLPSGTTPFGYRREYHPVTKEFVRQIEEPAESAVVREIYQRLHSGHSLRSIAIDFERRGIRTRTGRVWSAQHLRSLALNPTYSGQRVHDPGRVSGHTLSANATFTEAQWPALVDRSVFLAVQAKLTDPSRIVTRPGRAVHLLSMIAKCDVCDGSLAVRLAGRGPEYTCHKKGCVRVAYDELNDYATKAVLGYLKDYTGRLTTKDNAELRAARTQVAEIRHELDDLADRLGAGEVSAKLASRAEQRIMARLKVAEAREQELAVPDALRAIVGASPKSLKSRWEGLPTSAKREVARMVLSPEMLGELRVGRSATPGHRCPVEDRVVWRYV